jgi:RNA polymerase sigma-70 factor (ECF subfamily)
VADLADGRDAVAASFRSDWGRVVAYLIRVTGDWDLAEECAQDAFERALERWPRDGVPSSPVGWLVTTARNRALDRLRRSKVGDEKLKEFAMLRMQTTSSGEDPATTVCG